MTQVALEEFEKEASVMQGLQPHDNVVSLLGTCNEPFSLITEFVELGSLDVWRQGPGKGALEAELIQIARGVAKGVSYLHAEGIIHRE